MEYKVLESSAFMLLITLNVSLAFVVLVIACVCCKRQVPKNELLGLEGMVKLKNPDEVVVHTIVSKSESQVELNLSTISNADSDKRASTAAHRSLPDIPIAEANGDTGSELYETVADKRLLEAQGIQNKNSSLNLKKQISVSQHSSISQADDVSSPYSRVKNSPHGYAKVLSTEHPYAQLNAPSTSAAAASTSAISAANSSNHTGTDSINRNSHNSGSMQDSNDGESQVDIPAASAIAGMISASQDLPYMTPPVATQHFSGDSQDSSKGYTSISVREPLANILAQQPTRQPQRNSTLPRDVNDSHYATVSDDSDETYAAIEDPNLRNNPNLAADIYTSGSETYAQIQPMQSVVVSVEINNTSAPSSSYHSIQALQHNNNNAPSNASIQTHAHTHQNRASIQAIEHATPIPPPVDSLRAQMHSRQASSSSNNSSSVGNLGSPKPEKRQANSPLPPTPKSSNILQGASSNNLTSGRSSVISVIELTGETTEVNEKYSNNANDNSPFKKHKSLSPSKDIEGMYAKVMKKNKFSTRDSPPSQGNSPVMTRKQSTHATALALGVTPLDSSTVALMDTQKINISTSERNRSRCNSYSAKDHGYETIPADVHRKSDCYTHILQKERQQLDSNVSINAENLRFNYTSSKPPNNSVTPFASAATSTSTSNIKVNQNVSYQSDKHYETIAGPRNSSDPGYETLLKPKGQTDTDNEKKSSDYDPNYEVLKGPANASSAGLSDDGYAKVVEKKRLNVDEDSIDGYSKVKGDEGEDGYSTIREFKENSVDNDSALHNYASISEAKNVLNMSNDTTLSPMPDLLPLSAISTPVQSTNTVQTEHKMRPNELPTMLSPSSFTSSSFLNNSSAASSANLTTTSTISTFSSRQTPSSSQYESLTGSDTDPNYESVSYVQTNRSNSVDLNAYEPLNADFSDTQLSSPRTPPDDNTIQSTSHTINTTGAAIVLNINAHEPTSSSLVSPKAATKHHRTTDTHVNVIVDDYFQV